VTMTFAARPVRTLSTRAWAAPVLLLASGACSRVVPLSGDRTAARDGAAETGVLREGAPSLGPDPSRDALAALEGAPSTAPPFPEARLKLLDSGEMPRRRLRYVWTVAKREQLTLDMRTSLAGDGAVGQVARAPLPLPSVRVVLVIEPQSASNDGTLIYNWRVASAGVAGDDRTVPQVADGMRAEVVAVEHLSGTGAVSSRGLGKDLTVNPPDRVSDVTSRPIALQVLETLWNVTAPMPDDEVGVGARWERVSELAAKSARATQTDVFTLVSFDAPHGVLDDALTQTAPEQSLSVPGIDNGTRAQMGSMLATGSAKTRFDLSRLVPETRFQGTTTMVLAGDGALGSGPSEPRTTMVLRVEIDLSGAAR
jgi:hypothetical protein